MEFTLFYRGPLGSNKGKVEKHALRKVFHKQLALFWNQNPLKDYRCYWDSPDEKRQAISFLRSVGPFSFVPLINEKWHLVADIQIQLLRPEPPGNIKAQAGDLDNRVKTLLDALRMPLTSDEIPSGEEPAEDGQPFFCLLEDDALINSFSVTTHRWLEPNLKPQEVILIISVRTAITKLMAYNAELAGNIL